uniref:uncharacterized protein LOC113474162 n=1 Tax=Ciona intestinalis TaxID=7719 RepID=UPI000521C37B|nr:uncharacterized protein LOC113474162 [Ciona intestinalis]|eukprot:XP_026689847.1 uncharacterized protein LOC113474162 [Ciona intestinalis]
MHKAVVSLLIGLCLSGNIGVTTGNNKYSGTFEKQIASSGGAKHFSVHYKKCYTSIPSSVQLTLTTYPIHLNFILSVPHVFQSFFVAKMERRFHPNLGWDNSTFVVDWVACFDSVGNCAQPPIIAE